MQDLPLLQHLVTMSYDEFHEEKAGYALSWCLGKVLLDKKSPWRQRLSDFLEGVDRANPWTSFVRTYPVDKIESEWEAELFRQRSGK